MTACPPVPFQPAAESLVGKVVVIMRESSPARAPIFEQLWQLGVRIVLVHPTAPRFIAQFVESWIECESDDVDLVERKIRALLQTASYSRADGAPDGVVALDDFAVYATAALCTRFGTRPQPFGTDEIRVTTSKELFRAWCVEHGVASPLSVVIARGGDTATASASAQVAAHPQKFEYPVVMKCSSGAGKMQTKLCATAAEVDAHAAVMWDFMDAMPEQTRKHIAAHGEPIRILVEEFIRGQEVDVDCVIENGKISFAAVMDNFEAEPPYFAEKGGMLPSELPDEAQLDLIALLESFLRSHGDKVHGVLHFEAKYDPARTRCRSFVIECNCRLANAETYTMLRTVYGVEMGEAVVRLALGMPAFRAADRPAMRTLANGQRLPPAPRCYCASVNLLPPVGGGVISQIRLPQSWEPSLVKAQCLHMGLTMLGPPRSFACVMWMVARGTTHDEARREIERLTAMVEVTFAPPPPPPTA